MSGTQKKTVAVPATTRERQGRATRPDASAWVSANAGSGKTYVLVGRVIRLMLAGTEPGRILCLTYTTAAAANMAGRIFQRLSRFATLDDAALVTELAEIEGLAPEAVPADLLPRARRLFARALETPGGLKIQTIHAFCAALLAQFPLEANVAGRFTVIDDQLAAELTEEGLARVLARAGRTPDSEPGRALALLVSRLSDGGIADLVRDLIGRREVLREWLTACGGVSGAMAALGTALGLKPGDDAAGLARRFFSDCRLAPPALARLGEALAADPKKSPTAARRLESLTVFRDPARPFEERRTAWEDLLFGADGEPRDFSRALTKAVANAVAGLEDDFCAEQARVQALGDRFTALRAVEATHALVTLAEGVLAHVEDEKRRRGLIDYADQVARAADLLTREDAAAWVRYKLDRSVEHILVDEAQDTSPVQWRVIRALAEEFFAGEGSPHSRRTIFAVGDEKQSIYGFQGAAPEEFARMRKAFGHEAAGAGQTFNDVELHLSFRSTPDVLAAVDQVFSRPQAYEGLTETPGATSHSTVRGGEPGLVELWPPEAPEKSPPPEGWLAALDAAPVADPQGRLAARIADTIAAWLREGACLAGGRPMRAGDILVLVRKRGPFVAAVNRALKQRGVPVAGADQIVLSDHIAIQDLIALAGALLLPEDDLTLAAVLKSPLVGLGEDDLYALAHDRPGTLWAALEARAGEPALAAAFGRLARWREAIGRVRPFEFFAAVLGPDGGRTAFLARLGPEVEEALDAFLSAALAHEQDDAATMQSFLAWFTAYPFRVRRETETEPREVRVMTVHGAKGLEAPVVFLVDSGGPAVVTQHEPKIIAVPLQETLSGPLTGLVWAPTKDMRPARAAARLDDWRRRTAEEYRRLLYVGLTRAADQLIVCGWQPVRGLAAGSWGELIRSGLAGYLEEATDILGHPVQRWRRPEAPAPAPAGPAAAAPAAGDAPARPAPHWMDAPAGPAPQVPRAVSPSSALSLADAEPDDALAAFSAPLPGAGSDGAALALARGRMVHRAMELAGGLAFADAAERRETLTRLITREAGLLPQAAAGGAPLAARLVAEVMAILDDPAFAPLFGPGGRSEVPLTGRLIARSGEEIEISGRIDRLMVEESRVLILDFKTDRAVPAGAHAVPETHLAQMALYRALIARLYPGHAVEAALLYTAAPLLLPLPPAALDAIAARLLAPGANA